MQTNPLIEFIDKFKTFNKESLLTDLISICTSYDLYFNYERNPNETIAKIILRIRKTNKTHPLTYYHCNGAVIDVINWKVLSVPPIAFNKQHIFSEINKYFELYNIIKVIDGTVVTFYYHNKKWCISSSNGYDVSAYLWIGNMTYSEIIYDLMSRLYPNAITATGLTLIDSDVLDFTTLNKDYSYTIGFRHHNFHPLLSDPEKMWNIQHVHLPTMTVKFNDGILNIPNQIIFEKHITLDEMIEKNKSSINDAIRSNLKTLNYGYILRSKDPLITKEFSSVLLDSALLKRIKKNVYEYPSNSIRQYITHENRFEYIAIKNYFNKLERNEFLQLYPQLLSKYNLYTSCVSETVSCMIVMLKNKQTNSNEPITDNSAIYTLATALLKYILKFETLDPFNADIESILKDYIMNFEYSVLFLHAINKYSINK